jgi:hypothetical protein
MDYFYNSLIINGSDNTTNLSEKCAGNQWQNTQYAEKICVLEKLLTSSPTPLRDRIMTEMLLKLHKN